MEPKITVEGDVMTIVVNLATKGRPSASGKTTVIGTTSGNKAVETPRGTVYVGLNVYKK